MLILSGRHYGSYRGTFPSSMDTERSTCPASSVIRRMPQVVWAISRPSTLTEAVFPSLLMR